MNPHVGLPSVGPLHVGAGAVVGAVGVDVTVLPISAQIALMGRPPLRQPPQLCRPITLFELEDKTGDPEAPPAVSQES